MLNKTCIKPTYSLEIIARIPSVIQPFGALPHSSFFNHQSKKKKKKKKSDVTLF